MNTLPKGVDLAACAIPAIIGIEGGLGNDPLDSGGETKYGITLGFARDNGCQKAIKDLTPADATDLYRRGVWDKLRLSSVANISPACALELFDSGVNCGIGRSGEWLQRALNAFNNSEKYYGDLLVDGSIGPKTIETLAKYVSIRGTEGAKILLRTLDSLQLEYYVSLSQFRPKDERFVYGWVKERTGSERWESILKAAGVAF